MRLDLPKKARMSGLHRSAGRIVVAGALAGVVALPSAMAAAATTEPAETTLVVRGVLERVIADHGEADESVVGEHESDISTVVEVDGRIYQLPDDVVVEGATGDDIVVTVVAEAGATVDEAMTEIDTAATTAELAEADPGTTGEETARVVSAETAADQTLDATTEGDVLEVTLGGHTLTVLPVYWSAKDSATKNSLSSVASAAASYWTKQSGGRLSVSASSREWTQIADPGTCDATKIYNSAISAHGSPAVSATQHVVVYFPKRSDCGGWAGRATVGGGKIWVNGSQVVDVMAHEFGHNLGLGHANTMTCTVSGARVPMASPVSSHCTQQAYGDYADVMGIGMNLATGNLNSAFADYLGFASVKTVSTSPASTTIQVAPLSGFSSTRAVKVATGDGTVYLDYRPAVSPDLRRTAWAGVQVHLRRSENGIPYTYLLDMQAPRTPSFSAVSLPVGATWDVPGTAARVGVRSTGSTATIGVGSTSAAVWDDGISTYVTRVYQDLFKRAPDAAGLAHWSNALRTGTPRVAVANSITSSTEFRSRLIAQSYRKYLNRTPDAGGLSHWLRMMDAGMTIQQMEAGFLASPEYYIKAGGTNAAWVKKLYGHVLGRTPATSEVSYWVKVIGSGGSQSQVAVGFLMSTEHLTTVVDGHYRHLLGRGIDPSGRKTWVSAIQRGTRVEVIIGNVVASDEYFAQK